jgi:hypothetical protein
MGAYFVSSVSFHFPFASLNLSFSMAKDQTRKTIHGNFLQAESAYQTSPKYLFLGLHPSSHE